jgi:hypothetical protein
MICPYPELLLINTYSIHNSKPLIMKKFWILSILLLAVVTVSVAQQKQPSTDCEGAFSKGTNIIGVGVGVGDLYWVGSGYTSSFPVNPTVTWDMSITNKLGIGNIGVGLMLSYASSKLDEGGGYTYTYTGIFAGVRGTYHFIIAKSDKFDPYAGVMLGYVFSSNTNNLPSYGYTNPYGSPIKNGGFLPGFFAGVHYYFSPAFGVNGEVGYDGFSFVLVGVAFRFGGCGSGK